MSADVAKETFAEVIVPEGVSGVADLGGETSAEAPWLGDEV